MLQFNRENRAGYTNTCKEGFYAVAKGRLLGIFSNWHGTVSKLVQRFSGPVFKKFDEFEAAFRFLSENIEEGVGSGN